MFQLPGFASEPVRVSLELTWHPIDDLFSCSVRVWVKQDDTGTWAMEQMEAGPTVYRHQVNDAVTSWAARWAAWLEDLAAVNADVRDRPW